MSLTSYRAAPPRVTSVNPEGLSRYQRKPLRGLSRPRKPQSGLSCVSSVNPKGLSRVGILAVPTKFQKRLRFPSEATKAALAAYCNTAWPYFGV